MSKEILFEITLDGKSVNHCNSITLTQGFNTHHTFELVLDQDTLGTLGSHDLHDYQDYIGKGITISFGERHASDNLFHGLVTEVSLQQQEGAWGKLLLKGSSPTCLLDSGSNYASYETKNLKNIVNECIKNTSQGDIKLISKPRHTDNIPYMCQYNESGFSFLNRLSAEYGEWFFYDGTALCFGKPAKQSNIDLIYGINISAMNFSMRVLPVNACQYSYLAQDDEIVTASSPDQVEGASGYTQKALEVSKDLYKNPVKQPASIHVSDKSEIEAHAKIEKEKRAASTLILQASGDNPKVVLGNFISIKLSKKTGTGFDDHGEYLVTKITHELTGTGAYKNSFEAIPSGNEVLPFSVVKPIAQTQIALVTDNADPDSMGRVRVQMLWQQNTQQKTDWIRVIMPDAGSSSTVNKNRGHVFIPEIDDQVVVGFHHNDPNKPFVLGSLFHGNNAAGGGQNNNFKTIKTRSGHTLEFNDTEGQESITITDTNNNIITLDTNASSIKISSPENISITAKNIDITAKENISMTAGTDISLSAQENIISSAGENITQHAGKDASLAAKNIINQAQENISRDAKIISDTAQEISANSTHKDMKLASGKKVNMQSGEKVKLF